MRLCERRRHCDTTATLCAMRQIVSVPVVTHDCLVHQHCPLCTRLVQRCTAVVECHIARKTAKHKWKLVCKHTCRRRAHYYLTALLQAQCYSQTAQQQQAVVRHPKPVCSTFLSMCSSVSCLSPCLFKCTSTCLFRDMPCHSKHRASARV
jgi:hypothetical protein